MRAVSALAIVAACAAVLPAADAETYPNVDVYRADAGGRLTDLTPSPALDTSPSPSPDGSRIAFVSSRSGSPEIYVMRAAGGAAVRLTTSPFDDQMVAWNDAGKTSIAWSADGKRIAFDVQNTTYPPTCQKNCVVWSVYLINSDGTGLHSVATEARSPAWSRDGRLAYEDTVTPYGEALRVAIDRLDGSRVLVAAFNPDASVGPSWSPRRNELVYQANHAIYSVGAIGQNRHRLSRGAQPTWSPDGSAIAFVRDGAVYRVARTGVAIKRLTPGRRAAALPAWSPDGRRIAFLGGGGRQTILLADASRLAYPGTLRGPPAGTFDTGPEWARRGGALLFALHPR
jgi:Tol biopolymer transport system component